jgi:enoyl-CoA hydratase
VGKVKAMEMLLTGEPITAKQALDYGLVNKVVPMEVYFQEVLKLAKQIAQQPPVAARMIKKSVLKALDNPLDEAMDYERNCFYLLFASEDKREGMQAFVEKRRPKFIGK